MAYESVSFLMTLNKHKTGKEPSRAVLYRRNMIWSLVLQTSNILLTLILPRVMIESYGSEQNGLVASITQIVTMFLVVEAGLSNAAMVTLYKPLAERASLIVRSLMESIDRLFKPVALVFSILIVILAILYPVLIDVDSMTNVEVSLLILVMGLNGVADFLFFAKYRVLLNASQRAYLVSQASVVYVLLNGGLICFAAFGGLSLVDGRAIGAIAIVFKLLLLRYSGRKLVDFRSKVDKKDAPSISNRGDVLFQQILGSVQVGAPAILATIFTSLNEVSVLSMYLIVALGLINVVSILCSAATAGFGHLFASGKMSALRRAFSDLEVVFSYGVGITFGVCLFLVSSFVDLYVNGLDSTEYNDPILGILVCVNAWLYVIKAPYGTLVIAAGHFRQTRYRVLAQGLILVVLGVILAPFFGLYGIMIANIASNLYRVIDMAVYVPKQILHSKVSKSVARVLQSFLIFLSVGLFGIFLADDVSSWSLFVVWGLVGVFVGVLLVALLAFLFERKSIKALKVRLLRS